MVNVDASLSFRDFENVDADWRQMNGDHDELNRWLPWVRRIISNAKTWIIGTHHGVEGTVGVASQQPDDTWAGGIPTYRTTLSGVRASRPS